MARGTGQSRGTASKQGPNIHIVIVAQRYITLVSCGRAKTALPPFDLQKPDEPSGSVVRCGFNKK
eukprot:scaffold507867_cov32-Prasinocladus_malaysianus.AAC.1